MLLVVINQSINAPDVLENRDSNPFTLEEDLSINEMESILELVLEKCLNVDNAFPEEEEEDSFELRLLAKLCQG
ncbi:hypothetical protein DUE52_21915 [Larkinella punicea]|uniref:Uncharacterized protein n=2 Tax=Larkinella punicea TaxID=2315727 RepID=A0A368JMU5_9BACT|nr:hypothetical protein DUE52_21915 [Larkinella punicea]